MFIMFIQRNDRHIHIVVVSKILRLPTVFSDDREEIVKIKPFENFALYSRLLLYIGERSRSGGKLCVLSLWRLQNVPV